MGDRNINARLRSVKPLLARRESVSFVQPIHIYLTRYFIVTFIAA